MVPPSSISTPLYLVAGDADVLERARRGIALECDRGGDAVHRTDADAVADADAEALSAGRPRCC